MTYCNKNYKDKLKRMKKRIAQYNRNLRGRQKSSLLADLDTETVSLTNLRKARFGSA